MNVMDNNNMGGNNLHNLINRNINNIINDNNIIHQLNNDDMNNNQYFYNDLANRIRNNIINNRNNDLNIINNVNNDNFANIIRNYFIEYRNNIINNNNNDANIIRDHYINFLNINNIDADNVGAVNQNDDAAGVDHNDNAATAADNILDHHVLPLPDQEVMPEGWHPGGGQPGGGQPEVVVQDTTDDIAVPKCRICMENTCVVVFVPCGHVCSCTECSDRVDSCPVCRAEITRKQGLFFA